MQLQASAQDVSVVIKQEQFEPCAAVIGFAHKKKKSAYRCHSIICYFQYSI